MRAKLDETYNMENSEPTNSYPHSHSSNPNSTFTKGTAGPGKVINTTITSYDITPARHELPPEELVDEDNYDIGDLKSDEDTDDEDAPRKVIPKWASGTMFKTALLNQAFKPPDVDKIFWVMEMSPNLVEIFPKDIKRRFHTRTSSRYWQTAPTTHKF